MIRSEWWGLDQPYEATWRRQHQRREALIRGEGSPCLALLEHRSVLTVGRREAPGTPDRATLAAHGIDRFKVERGGLATWHGPGQLVGYLICDVWALGLGARSTVCALESGLIGYLGDLGLAAQRREGLIGVWIGEQKIASVGMHFKRGHSLHGFSLNLRCDPGVWSLFTPCGLSHQSVVSAHQLLGDAPSPRVAADPVAACVLAALGAGG